MGDKVLTVKVKGLAKELGIDLVGIAPIERFREAPPQAHPATILPKARSVISLAIRLNRTIQKIYLIPNSGEPFSRFASSLMSNTIDKIANEVANFLEDHGHDACPLPADSDLSSLFNYPQISHRHVAVAAGLGHIGWSNNLITPEFGAGVKLTSIITTARLEPDPVRPSNSCLHCLACVNICPVEALHPTESQDFNLDGLQYRHSKHQTLRCLWSCLGLVPLAGGRQLGHAPLTPDFIFLPEGHDLRGALNLLREKGLLSNYQSPLTPNLCSYCLVVCHPEDQMSDHRP